MRFILIIILTLGVLGSLASQENNSVHPTLVIKSKFKKTIKVSQMKAITNEQWLEMKKDGERKNKEHKERRKDNHIYPPDNDPVIQNFMPKGRGANAPLLTFEGAESAYYPSDANGDVDSNYYVQTVNATFSVYTKTGTLKAGPIAINTLFTGLPGGSYNDGDPIVLYDDQANRWVITEMSKSGSNDYLMMAVSQSSNPLGAWYAYSFDVDDWPDYPKYGVWRDAYYIGIDKLGNNTQDQEDVFAVQRSKMLLGQEAKMVGFINPDRPNTTYSVTFPVDNDGSFAPINSPGIFVNINDGQWNAIKDQLWIYEMDVDWNTPSNSTFTRTQTIDVAEFTPAGDISQPVGGSLLDGLGSFVMNKPVYRNFSTSNVTDQVIVLCHTVQGSTTTSSGIRWYELTNTGYGWQIRQQSTYAPDNNYRWNPSININPNRRIALAYSITGSSINPQIRYAGQSPSAHAAANSTLDIAEETVTSTTYLQSGSNRWGDYSSLSIDPANDTIFWLTNQYIDATGARKTKISKFKFTNFTMKPDFYADRTEVGKNVIVKMANMSYGDNITSYQWSISPSTYSFAAGTNANSQEPWIQFSAAGLYNIQLEISDGTNYVHLMKNGYIIVTDCSVGTYPYIVDFENSGDLPNCWTMEYDNEYNEDWVSQNGDSLFHNAHGGTYNAFFKKDGAITRLVSPELYLTPLTTFPQLDFWYLQDGNSVGYDEFKVLYRASETAEWRVLKTYNKQASSWTHDTIVLPAGTAHSYIAFESSTSNGGYGVCIDDIKIGEKNISCAEPTGPVTDSITSTSAVFAWNDELYSPTWEIEYGPDGFSQGTGTQLSNLSDSSYSVTGLTASTIYNWYVRRKCSAGVWSDWVGPMVFTTTEVPYTLPVTEDFEGGFVKFVNPSGNSVDFTLSTSIKHGGSKSAYNNYGSNNQNYLKMNSFVDLSQTTHPFLSFWSIAKTDGGGDNCKVQISTDNGSTWRTLPTISYEGDASNYSSYQRFNEDSYSDWSGFGVANSWWKKEIYSLSQYKAEKVRIRFCLSSDNSTIDEGWYIDDITIEDNSCPSIYPDSLFTTNVGYNSATLSWVERGSATSWDIEYGTSGFIQGNGTTITATTSNPYSLTGLNGTTTYDWYVRANCGSSTYSEWRGPESFTTTCASSDVPFFEDFEGVTTPNLPSCFNSDDKNNDGIGWKTNSYGAFSGTKSAGSATSATRASNDWMFTPGINMHSGVSYQIAFAYASLGGHEALEVKYGNYPDIESMNTTAIYTNNDITDWSYQVATINFTPSSTGVFYFGFHDISPLGSSGFNLDDIYINVNSNVANWTGSTDNNWYYGPNWGGDTIPTKETVVNISATATNFPTLDKLALAKTLTLNSTAAGNASLMGESFLSTTNDVNVEQFFSGGKWHLMSAPVDTVTLNDLYFSNNPDVWIKRYNEPDDSWTYMSSLNTQLPIGWGYAVWVDAGNNATATFSGSLNSSDVYLSEFDNPPLSWTGATHGYNLVGNPYASALDWDSGSWDTTNIEGSIWVWSDAAGNYLYRNSQGQGNLTNGIIPRGQGFFIRAKSTNMYFTIPADARVHSNQFYKESYDNSSFAVIRGEKDNSKYDEAWISFSIGASDDFDHGFDVEKLFSEGDSPEIYLNFDNEDYSLLALPELFLETRIIDMSYKAGENGEQKITLQQSENMDNFDILLEDTKLNTFTDLKKEGSYIFQATTYQNPDRFKLHFTSYLTNINQKESIDNILVYSNNSKIFINRNADDLKTNIQIELFDIMGRKTSSVLSKDKLIIIDNLKTNNYYLVKLKSHGKTVVKKVFVR